MNQTYMKEKKIFPLVMSMALPMMLSMHGIQFPL